MRALYSSSAQAADRVGVDDERNLRAAIALREVRPDAAIFVRCGYRSAFIAELSAELELTVLSVDEMLRQTIAERLDEWVDVR